MPLRAHLKFVQSTGIQPPPSILEATAAYQKNNDKLARFIADEMEAGSGYEVKTAEAFERYKEWCITNMYQPGGSGKFNSEMAAHAVITRKRPQKGGEKTTIILGYKLIPTQQEIPNGAGWGS